MSRQRLGNLGEFISFCIGQDHVFSKSFPFPANALSPLSKISKPDIDIVWVYFDKIDPAKDSLVVQEVKTAARRSLNLAQFAQSLPRDIAKLFGTNIALTLQTRLQGIKNELEFKLKRPELCSRIDKLGGNSPEGSPRIFILPILPTLVHDMNNQENQDAIRRLGVVSSTIISMGWSQANVDAWSIALSELEGRLVRLARGKA